MSPLSLSTTRKWPILPSGAYDGNGDGRRHWYKWYTHTTSKGGFVFLNCQRHHICAFSRIFYILVVLMERNQLVSVIKNYKKKKKKKVILVRSYYVMVLRDSCGRLSMVILNNVTEMRHYKFTTTKKAFFLTKSLRSAASRCVPNIRCIVRTSRPTLYDTVPPIKPTQMYTHTRTKRDHHHSDYIYIYM